MLLIKIIIILLLTLMFIAIRKRFFNSSQNPRAIPKLNIFEIFRAFWSALVELKPEERLQCAREYQEKFPNSSRIQLGNFNIVFCYDPELMRKIFNSSVCIDRPIVEFLRLDKGIASLKGTEWRTRRKHLNLAFNLNVLKEYITLFAEICDMTIQDMQVHMNDGNEFNLFNYISQIEIRSILATTVNIQGLDLPFDEINKFIQILSEILCFRIINPFLHMEFIYQRTNYFKREMEIRKYFHELGNKLIKNAKENFIPFSEEENFEQPKIRPLVELLLNDKEIKYSDDEIRDQIFIFLLTGAETSSILLSNTMLFLAINQDIQENLYEEIKNVLPSIYMKITYEAINQMSYLDRVVKEGLRLGSALGITLRETNDSFNTGHEILPKGTAIVLYNFMLHRRKEFWGNDPDKFNPDHFLPENVAKRPSYSYVPYGMGIRNCIGHRHATLSVKTMIIRLLQHYKFASSLKEIDLKFIFSFTQKLSQEHLVSIQRRQ